MSVVQTLKERLSLEMLLNSISRKDGLEGREAFDRATEVVNEALSDTLYGLKRIVVVGHSATGKILAVEICTVVEEVRDPDREIALSNLGETVFRVGDEIARPLFEHLDEIPDLETHPAITQYLAAGSIKFKNVSLVIKEASI